MSFIQEKIALAFLRPFKNRIEAEISIALETMGEKTKLRDACAYALESGGKRFRPLIVLLIGEALPFKLNVIPSALSVEFFHTASLIADDLPCMDNDDERRNKPTLHKVYEESVALLASYTLISQGYSYIQKNAAEMAKNPSFANVSDKACSLALQIVSELAGISGATGGQFLDLFPPDGSLTTLRKIIYQKTVTLFEIAFVLGWLFAGGDFTKLMDVRKCAFHLGMAFQIGDDLQDVFQDKKQEGESNIAVQLGISEAVLLFCKEMSSFQEKLKELGLYSEGFRMLNFLLLDLVRKSIKGAQNLSALQELITQQ